MRGRRGPKTDTRERIAREMISDLSAGKITIDRLMKMSGPKLCEQYKAHRDTCYHARQAALAEFQSR